MAGRSSSAIKREKNNEIKLEDPRFDPHPEQKKKARVFAAEQVLYRLV